MQRKLITYVALAVALLMNYGPAFCSPRTGSVRRGASHPLKGTVTSFLWSNPHCLKLI